MSNFKHLNLDRTIIETTLHNIPNCTINCTNSTDAKETYQIQKDESSCILNIFNNKNGTTTLGIQGKNADLGQEICTIIKQHTQIFELPQINQSLIITDNHFTELLEKVKTNFSNSLTEKQIPGGTSYVLEKNRDGKFTFNFYNKNKKLLLQGKALQFFSLIVNILTDQGYDVFNKVLEGSQEIELEESEKLLNEHLPLLSPKLQEPIKNILTPSLQLIKVKSNFPDFSIILFPALKTLEHVIISVLEENNFTYDSKNGFTMYSWWTPTSSYKLDTTDTTQLSDITKNRLEKCYTFYNKQRHGLFHLGSDLTEIRTIETQQEAIDLLVECIELMEDISDDFPS